MEKKKVLGNKATHAACCRSKAAEKLVQRKAVHERIAKERI